MVFPLTKLNKVGTLLNASHSYYSEEYAQRMCSLYLTDELSRDETGKIKKTYRLHASNDHTEEMAFAYEIHCSNMAKSGMNPKTLQYLMGHSDISVTMNVYTHIGFDDAEEELKQMEEFRKAQAEIEKKNDAKAVSQKMFKIV